MTPERIQQIQELYHAACENRAALDHADPELRREVESLLVQQSGNDGPLVRPAIEVAAGLLQESAVAGLAPGVQLGPYKIESALGKGGMGEVWKARDTRLNRFVAIKKSQAHFSERFAREAQAIAALNHPNICTLYDIGPDYLVMELVEGSSPKGPLSLDEALRIAGQVAAALEAAHEKGIIHRDLKPANVKITPGGLVKVLDFGLAKIVREASWDGPTVTTGLTEAGVALGTPAYMAPEQAQGNEVDKRTDVWAFGVLLYELLTGHRPFLGDSVQSTLAAVVDEGATAGETARACAAAVAGVFEERPAGAFVAHRGVAVAAG
jgi:eukaryotic-like serine/threonine-protein kinase